MLDEDALAYSELTDLLYLGFQMSTDTSNEQTSHLLAVTDPKKVKSLSNLTEDRLP